MIKFIDTTLVYSNQVTALRNINLRVKKQEFVTVVGPTGCGKSSLLKLMYRDAVPTSGKVFVFHRDLASLHKSEVPYLRRRIGVVFQDFLLIPGKTSRENVAYALEARGCSRREINSLVPEVLEMVGLDHKLDALPSQLSGGEQQRVCIARALVNKPDLLLADEPTGNLDPETSRGIMDLMAKINRRGTTVIVASHDRQVVDNYGDRLVRIEAGEIVRDERREVRSGA